MCPEILRKTAKRGQTALVQSGISVMKKQWKDKTWINVQIYLRGGNWKNRFQSEWTKLELFAKRVVHCVLRWKGEAEYPKNTIATVEHRMHEFNRNYWKKKTCK